MDKKRKAAASKDLKDTKQDAKRSKDDAKGSRVTKANSQTKSKAKMQGQSMLDVRRNREVASDLHMQGSLTAPVSCKNCYFYKDDDITFAPIKMAVHSRSIRKFDVLLLELSRRMPGLAFGVRSLYTPEGHDCIKSLDALTDNASYVCSAHRHYAKGLDMSKVQTNPTWRNVARPSSGRMQLTAMLADFEFEDTPRYVTKSKDRAHDLASIYTKSTPKKITVMLNGEPSIRHIMLLNRRTAQTFEQILKDISDLFGVGVRKLYRVDGVQVQSLQSLFSGPEVFIAAGNELFKLMTGFNTNRSSKATVLHTARLPATDNIAMRMKDKRERLSKTKGRWKVWVTTNEMPNAATQALVTMTVYGHKGNSGPITLGMGDGNHFCSGNIDQFDVSVGNVGEIYKVRICHNNIGDTPGWLCDEIRMLDMDTDEELVFLCCRWLARDEDDHEISRELPAIRRGDPVLPVMRYEVQVTTGEMWNSGTDANVYITMYGDRGDTGVRQLYREYLESCFRKGETDAFFIEAVSLGHLRRIIIGHDATGQGNGWFLEKIIVTEPGSKTHDQSVFYCGKWLDEAEDDGKIVRELKIQEEYIDDILEKRNWEFERWKFEKDNQLMFYSLVTSKAMRLNRNMTLDALGDTGDLEALFVVTPKKSMNRIFCSFANAHHYLAIDNGRMSGQGKGGPYCEFRVRVQQDRSVLLESVRNPLQFLTFNDSGQPDDVRGIIDKEPTRRFNMYCKGMFRHMGIVVFCSSPTQAIAVEADSTLTGTARRKLGAHFTIHKVDSGGFRMFESVGNPGKYLRLKDGKIDILGGRDELSHFIVERHRDLGYVTLQSASQRGIHLGFTPEGIVRPTINTGVRNICLYPEVIKFGIPKTRSTAIIEKEAFANNRIDPKPSIAPETKKQNEDGDWSIHVGTLSNLKDADVALVAYGDKGNSGAIILAAPPGKSVFVEDNNDEFRANFAKVGKVNKIRLELVPKSLYKDPSWKVGEVKMQDLATKETLKFTFNRWLSRKQEDREIMRELPALRIGEEPLSVLRYHIAVYTGKEEGAETDARVHINLYGQRGDTGRHLLLKSNNAKMFKSGQLDIFQIEAVSLGKLEKCIVGHDGTGAGQGWYLDQIIVRESEDTKEEFVFPCERWLDSSLEDRKIERILKVQEPSFIRLQDEFYTMTITTHSDSHPVDSMTAVVVFYGDNGISQDIILPTDGADHQYFLPGCIDSSEVSLGNIGSAYKARVSVDHNIDSCGWLLHKIELCSKLTNITLVFAFNHWFGKNVDRSTLVAEAPVIEGDISQLPVYKYEVEIHTGNHWAGGTEADVFVTLYGERGDSGERILCRSVDSADMFRPGQISVFIIESVCLKKLTKVKVRHNNDGHGAGCFLDKVVIRQHEGPYPQLKYICPCYRWLDIMEDDGKIERELFVTDSEDASKPLQNDPQPDKRGEYHVMITSDVDMVWSPAWLTLFQSPETSYRVQLDEYIISSLTIGLEKRTEFLVNIADCRIQKILKICLEHENSASWKVMKIIEVASGAKLAFYANEWMMRREGQTWKCELPAVRVGTMPQPVLQYIVTLSGITQHPSDLSLCLHGEFGSTGMQELPDPLTTDLTRLEGVFLIKAMSVGKLAKVQLQAKSQTQFADVTICVKESVHSPSQNIFTCVEPAEFIDSSCVVEDFILKDICPSTDPSELLSRVYPNASYSHTSYTWTVSLSQKRRTEGHFVPFHMVLYGTEGHSEPVLIEEKNLADLYHVIPEILTGKIGLLFKVRLQLRGRNGSSLILDKLELKNNYNGEEFWYHSIKLECSTVNPQGMIELAAVYPDIQPFQERVYFVSVLTGDRPCAETEADVYCNLIGQWGDTGHRIITKEADQTFFKRGLENTVKITCVELGTIKSVVISHNKKGRGCGWFCDKVFIRSPHPETEIVFPCRRWLDTGCEDHLLSRELYPYNLSKISDIDYYIEVHTSDEEWDGGTLSSVYITLHGETRTTGRHRLTRNEANILQFPTGHVALFTIVEADVGPVKKIVLVKAPGPPLLLDRIVVKSHMFAATESVFVCRSWIGSDENSKDEVEVTLRLTDVKPSSVAEEVDGTDEPNVSYDKWLVEVVTGGVRGEKDISDVVVTFCGDKGESRFIQLKSSSSHSFQVGMTDVCKLTQDDYVGELKKIRIGFQDRSTHKGWYIRKIRFDNVDTGDTFSYELADWVAVDNKQDGWKEIPVIWPAVLIPQVLKYEVFVECEDGGAPNSRIVVCIQVYGEFGTSGLRELKHSTTNPIKFQQNQTDLFTIEAVSLGKLSKIVIRCDGKKSGRHWFIQRVSVRETLETEKLYVFDCEQYLEEVDEDPDTERTVLPMDTIRIPRALVVPDNTVSDIITPTEGSLTRTQSASTCEPPIIMAPMEEYVQIKPVNSHSPKSDIIISEKTIEENVTSSPTDSSKQELVTSLENLSLDKPVIEQPIVKLEEQILEQHFVDFRDLPMDVPLIDISKSIQARHVQKKLAIESLSDDFLLSVQSTELDSPSSDRHSSSPSVTASLPGHCEHDILSLQSIFNTDTSVERDKQTPILQVNHGNQTAGKLWKIWITTGIEPNQDMTCPVELVLYGLNGHSEPIILRDTDGLMCDQGTTEDFEVVVKNDIGELYKIRVGFHCDDMESDVWYSHYSLSPRWHLESLLLKDVLSGKSYTFQCNKWIVVDETGDFWKEFPVLLDDGCLPVLTYEIDIYTGDVLDASTDGTVWVQLFGQRGDTGFRRLTKKQTMLCIFQQGKKDMFELEAVDIQELEKVRIRHKGLYSHTEWYLDKIVLRESKSAERSFVFLCQSWLANEDEGKDFLLSDVEYLDMSPKGCDWRISVHTSDSCGSEATADGRVTVTVYGDRGNTGPVVVGNLKTDSFRPGQMAQCNLSISQDTVGSTLRKIRLEHDSILGAWAVEKVVLDNRFNKHRLEFLIHRTLSLHNVDTDIAIEMPVMMEGELQWTEKKYTVKVVTSNVFGAGTESMVYINIYGNQGDCGKHFLRHSLEGGNIFQTGMTNTFIVSAVDLGIVEKLVVGHKGHGPGSGWKLDHIAINDSIDTRQTFIFNCQRWLHEDKDDAKTERELLLSEVAMENFEHYDS